MKLWVIGCRSGVIFLAVAGLGLLGPISVRAQSGTRRHKKAVVADPAGTPTPKAEPSPTPEPPPPPITSPDSKSAAGPAAVSTVDPAEIEGLDSQVGPIHDLLVAALDLTRKNLTYTYGSSDPATGGMDCSGTIYYLLKQQGFTDVPRQASEQYSWVRAKARFYAVLSKRQETPELAEMRPGDLLFWTGTYHVDRDPPVTHTMIYLGRRKRDGHRLMVGASDGRAYDGQRRNGVSVFDFHLPAARSGDTADATTAAVPEHSPDFVGYGPIPGMADLSDAANRQTQAAHTQGDGATDKPAAASKESPGDTPKPKPKHTPRHSGE